MGIIGEGWEYEKRRGPFLSCLCLVMVHLESISTAGHPMVTPKAHAIPNKLDNCSPIHRHRLSSGDCGLRTSNERICRAPKSWAVGPATLQLWHLSCGFI